MKLRYLKQFCQILSKFLCGSGIALPAITEEQNYSYWTTRLQWNKVTRLQGNMVTEEQGYWEQGYRVQGKQGYPVLDINVVRLPVFLRASQPVLVSILSFDTSVGLATCK